MNGEKNSLVLGASWIGAKTVSQLAERGHNVIAVVQTRVTYLLTKAQRTYPGKIKIVFADLRVQKEVEEILKKHGGGAHIFQFAARAFGSSHTNSIDATDFDGNARINDNVIATVCDQHIEPASVSFSSSYFTYDAFGNECPENGYQESDLDPASISEEQLADLKKRNPYKWEKIRAEQEYLKIGKKYRINRFRFGNAKGEFQRYHPQHYHLVPRLFYLWNREGRKQITAQIYGDGTSTRAWVDANDIASGVLHVALNPDLQSDVWNIGGTASGEGQTTEQIIDAFGRRLKTPIVKTYRPEASGGHSIRLSTDKIRATGWQPKLTIEESMKLAAEGYLKFGVDARVSK